MADDRKVLAFVQRVTDRLLTAGVPDVDPVYLADFLARNRSVIHEAVIASGLVELLSRAPRGDRSAVPGLLEGNVYVLLHPDGMASAFQVESVEDDGSVGVDDYDDSRGQGGGSLSVRELAQVRQFPGNRQWERWKAAPDGTPRRQPPRAWLETERNRRIQPTLRHLIPQREVRYDRKERISPQAMAALGWTRTDERPWSSKLKARWSHRDGWRIEHCGHPTANQPWSLLGADGTFYGTGSIHGHPEYGTAWPTLAYIAAYVASLTAPTPTTTTAAKNPPKVTSTNVSAMRSALEEGGGSIPMRVPEVHARHLQRCVAAGLLELRGNRWHATASGTAALAELRR